MDDVDDEEAPVLEVEVVETDADDLDATLTSLLAVPPLLPPPPLLVVLPPCKAFNSASLFCNSTGMWGHMPK